MKTGLALILVDVFHSHDDVPTIFGAREMLSEANAVVAAGRAVGHQVCHAFDMSAYNSPRDETLFSSWQREDREYQSFRGGEDGAVAVDSLLPVAGDLIIRKQNYDLFVGTGAHEELQERGITRLVLLGQWIELCLLHSALSAVDLGYDVVMIGSAVSAAVPSRKDVLLGQLDRVLGVTLCADSAAWLADVGV